MLFLCSKSAAKVKRISAIISSLVRFSLIEFCPIQFTQIYLYIHMIADNLWGMSSNNNLDIAVFRNFEEVIKEFLLPRNV